MYCYSLQGLYNWEDVLKFFSLLCPDNFHFCEEGYYYKEYMQIAIFMYFQQCGYGVKGSW